MGKIGAQIPDEEKKAEKWEEMPKTPEVKQGTARCKGGQSRLFRISIVLNVVLVVALILLITFAMMKIHKMKEMRDDLEYAKDQMHMQDKDFMDCVKDIREMKMNDQLTMGT